MGKSQRTKGASWERDVATMLRARFPARDVYRTQQADRAYQSDVTMGRSAAHVAELGDVDPASIWFECISSHRPNLFEKLRQSVRDAEGKGKVPIVVAKKTRDPLGPVVALRWDDFCFLLGWPGEAK